MREVRTFDAEADTLLWWLNWYSEDFSWNGLGKLNADGAPEKPWQGWVVVEHSGGHYCAVAREAPNNIKNRPASLQDYWRADPEKNWMLRSDDELRISGELTSENIEGEHWHIIHQPSYDVDGEEIEWKSNYSHDKWKLVDLIIRKRLIAASETVVNESGSVSEIDFRAQLNGAVLCEELPILDESANQLHVCLNYSAHLMHVDYKERSFGPGAEFQNARFGGYVNFEGSCFFGSANFTNVMFSGSTRFNKVRFYKSTNFSMARFVYSVLFQKVLFQGNCIFERAVFNSNCEFSKIEFSENEVFWRGAFKKTLFEDFVDFSKSPYKLISMFDGARLDVGIHFPKLGEGDALNIFDHEVIAPITSLKGQTERDEAFKAVEHGAQVLKHQMRLASDPLREQRFYRFELIARRLQSTTHWSERVSSRLFGWLADYGLSVSRPLGCLVVTRALCATAYFGLARSASLLDPAGASQSVRVAIAPGHYYLEVPAAQDLILAQVVDGPSQRLNALANASASRIAEATTKGPLLFAIELGFIPVSDPMGHHTWAKDLSKQESWQSALFAFLRMTQRLISLILIFLTALALRRRFQIG
ncbi:MAG: pentapeptide repeat-containing protein [Oceanicaulis sp.]|nr:pentapeptide repeat-containing protein [Oceanicaulis sp.]